MKRVVTAFLVTGLLSASSVWAHEGHGHGHGHGHDKHAWKHWQKEQRWQSRHGYYAQRPVVQQYYYQPAPPVVYQPQPVYQPYYAGPPGINFNFRVPLN